MKNNNLDSKTVSGFGDEWSRFNQEKLSSVDQSNIFNDYFELFPWKSIDSDCSTGMDVGCGSGRWAVLVAPRVGILHVLDASNEAIEVARINLKEFSNVKFHNSSVDEIPVPDNSLYFAYSLGVLHHVPDTKDAIKSIYKKLKPGAPFLIYLYYAFDNRPLWFRLLWKLSDLIRKAVSGMPHTMRYIASQFIAVFIYWPIEKSAYILNKMQILPNSWPLEYYKDKSFYVMRTDALDRFGTRLEQRFTQVEIENMLKSAGFSNVKFKNGKPYWCAVSIKPALM